MDTPRVAVLPDDVANQIAAGEVVERPASVVKELVENALDAGATRIVVEVEDAGRTRIRVIDDGSGMARADAETAVLRHATSKLRRAEDLQAIATLGFRGEALPSIASVSRFQLITRRDADEVGTRIEIDGGGPARVSDAGAPVGTTIDVQDLFHNVPARRKFLKSDTTEMSQIQQLLGTFSLGQPHVHFRLTHGGRVTLDHPGVRQLEERAAQVLGREVSRRLHEVSADMHGMSVVGFVSGPQAAKSHTHHVHLFVNGRRVRDRNLHHALVSAYGADLGPGRFPQAVLYLHLPPGDVDVNVHPAKAEVRFAHPTLVHQVLHTAVRRTLERRPWREDAPLPLERVAEPARTYQVAPGRLTPSGALPGLDAWRDTRPAAPTTRPLPLGEPPPPPRASGGSLPPSRAIPFVGLPVAGTAPRPPEPPGAAPGPDAAPPCATAERPPSPAKLRVAGALSSGHALVESGDGELLIVHPRRAARDLARHALTELAERGEAVARPLVMPVMVELGPRPAKAVRARLGDLGRAGFWVESFGGATFQILGAPAATAGFELKSCLLGVADLLERAPSAPLPRIIDALSALAPAPEPARRGQVLEAWAALPPAFRSADTARAVPLPELSEDV